MIKTQNNLKNKKFHEIISYTIEILRKSLKQNNGWFSK
jgi:hypothetical protein